MILEKMTKWRNRVPRTAVAGSTSGCVLTGLRGQRVGLTAKGVKTYENNGTCQRVWASGDGSTAVPKHQGSPCCACTEHERP